MADDYATVRVARAWNEGPRLRALALDTGTTGFAAKHEVPGQYVKARPAGGGKEAFLAIASPPGSRELELLLQTSAPGEPERAVDALARLGAGDALEITAPGGKGYPIANERGRDILLFAGGSGISAIRSLLEHIAVHRADYGRCVLLFGARTADDLAYRSLFQKWSDCRVEVVPVLSRGGAEWKGRAGYVTAGLPDLSVEAAKTSAFVTGGKAFDASVTESLAKLGISRIFRNF